MHLVRQYKRELSIFRTRDPRTRNVHFVFDVFYALRHIGLGFHKVLLDQSRSHKLVDVGLVVQQFQLLVRREDGRRSGAARRRRIDVASRVSIGLRSSFVQNHLFPLTLSTISDSLSCCEYFCLLSKQLCASVRRPVHLRSAPSFRSLPFSVSSLLVPPFASTHLSAPLETRRSSPPAAAAGATASLPTPSPRPSLVPSASSLDPLPKPYRKHQGRRGVHECSDWVRTDCPHGPNPVHKDRLSLLSKCGPRGRFGTRRHDQARRARVGCLGKQRIKREDGGMGSERRSAEGGDALDGCGGRRHSG